MSVRARLHAYACVWLFVVAILSPSRLIPLVSSLSSLFSSSLNSSTYYCTLSTYHIADEQLGELNMYAKAVRVHLCACLCVCKGDNTSPIPTAAGGPTSMCTPHHHSPHTQFQSIRYDMYAPTPSTPRAMLVVVGGKKDGVVDASLSLSLSLPTHFPSPPLPIPAVKDGCRVFGEPGNFLFTIELIPFNSDVAGGTSLVSKVCVRVWRIQHRHPPPLTPLSCVEYSYRYKRYLHTLLLESEPVLCRVQECHRCAENGGGGACACGYSFKMGLAKSHTHAHTHRKVDPYKRHTCVLLSRPNRALLC